MKKTIEVEYTFNEWGLVFPIPIQFWPDGYFIATINTNRYTIFWRGIPSFWYGSWKGEGPMLQYGYLSIEELPLEYPNAKCIWTRNLEFR